MLVICDVDGTLIGGQRLDWACFGGAIQSILGFMPTKEFFAAWPEITAQAIVEAAIRHVGRAGETGLAEQIQTESLRRLRAARAADPAAFPARAGVREVLAVLAGRPGTIVAVATGDWWSTISCKLDAAGLDLSLWPLATSSDASRRTEIIALAAQRAGQPLSAAIYVGDGLWDLRACRELGIPFIGTGAKAAALQAAGAEHIVEPLEPAAFLCALEAVRAAGTAQPEN